MEHQLVAARSSQWNYLLGDEVSVLDLYLTFVPAWGPRRQRFAEVARHGCGGRAPRT
ncbi:MAG: hypothetical protein AB7G13_22480 [Lautropia sp.]